MDTLLKLDPKIIEQMTPINRFIYTCGCNMLITQYTAIKKRDPFEPDEEKALFNDYLAKTLFEYKIATGQFDEENEHLQQKRREMGLLTPDEAKAMGYQGLNDK